MENKDFERLFKTYYQLMFRVAYDMLRDEDASHDAVHEVFSSIWKKGKSLRRETEKEFLTRSVHNYCVNVIAKKEREEKLKKLYPIELSLTIGTRAEEERLRQIYSFIENEMPADTSRVLRLCFDEEKSYEETAKMLNFSVAYVNKHIVKALRMLRERFNPKG